MSLEAELEVIQMLLINFICVILIVVGIAWFLYGANVYNAPVGWTGIGLLIAGLVAIITINLSIYREKRPADTSIEKRKEQQKELKKTPARTK